MADEIRVTDPAAPHAHRAEIAANADVEATIPPDPNAARMPAAPAPDPAVSSDPSFARSQIEQTRARMSETIDEIEEVLVRKKESLQDRLDFLSPVRERPLAAVGAVFGAGLLLGLITGGGDDDGDHARRRGSHDEDLEVRAETWERRARRLLRIAREQEDEIEALSGRGGRRSAGDAWEDEDEDDGHDSGPSRLEALGDEVADRVTGYLTDAIHGLFGGHGRHR